MRSVLVVALLAISCAPRQNDLGGYVNGICEPTTRRDAQEVATTTGQFGVVGSTSVTADVEEKLVVVWRNGGPATALVVMAYRLDPPSTGTWVRWSEGYGSASPWGDVGYRVGLKPISRPGCWRLVPEGGRMEDGVVIAVRAA
jgi:hypothetical protein